MMARGDARDDIAPPEVVPDLSNLGLTAWPATVLVVGDGDLSYSLSLARLMQGRDVRIVATTLTSRCDMAQRYLRFDRIIDALESLPHVRVLFEVDATKLAEDAERLREAAGVPPGEAPRFDRVVFNFPHYGGRSKITRNRDLLRNFFKSAVQVVRQAGGQVWCSLKEGQGGTPAETTKRLPWGCTWQVQDTAAAAGMLMPAVHPAGEAIRRLAATDAELGYSLTGFLSKDQFFHANRPLSHVFALPHPTWCPRSCYPLRWEFSVAFDIDPESFSMDDCTEMLRKLLPGLRFQLVPFSAYSNPERHIYQRTVDCVFIAERVPLCKRDSHELMVAMKTQLSEQAAERCVAAGRPPRPPPPGSGVDKSWTLSEAAKARVGH